MTGIHPFRGQVVRQRMARDVVSPAYDALTVTQRRQFRDDHPNSFLHVTRSAEDEVDAATVDNPTLLARGRKALELLLDQGLFVSHGHPAFHIYRLVEGAHLQYGLVCEVSSEYYREVAKPHEATRPERGRLLAEHFQTVGAASSPIACAVRDDGVFEAELVAATNGPPIVDIAGDDGLQQTVWRIEDSDVEKRITDRLDGEALFIIDGHHRSMANQLLLDQGVSLPVLAAIFPKGSLHLGGFHRLVRPQGVLDAEVLLRAIARRFRVETISDVATVGPGQVALVLNREWHLVHFDERPIAGGPAIRLGSLDPVVLERELLQGIIQHATACDIEAIPDTEPYSVIARAAEQRGCIPIFVPPVDIEDMMAVAEGGLTLPAKSTYFTPKVRSGLFLRVFDELERS